MTDYSYLTLSNAGSSLVRDRGSRFIGLAFYADSEEDVKSLLQQVSADHHTSRHVCYAYRINPEQIRERSADAGEPSGTAGMPILQQIRQRNLVNTLVVVVRYFGGTLLGTGGLIQAYRQAASEALEEADIIVKHQGEELKIRCGYEELPRLIEKIMSYNGEVKNTDYDENGAVVTFEIRKSALSHFEQD